MVAQILFVSIRLVQSRGNIIGLQPSNNKFRLWWREQQYHKVLLLYHKNILYIRVKTDK